MAVDFPSTLSKIYRYIQYKCFYATASLNFILLETETVLNRASTSTKAHSVNLVTNKKSAQYCFMQNFQSLQCRRI